MELDVELAVELAVELLPVPGCITGDELALPDGPEPADPLPIDDTCVDPAEVLPVADRAIVEVVNATSTRTTRIRDVWNLMV